MPTVINDYILVVNFVNAPIGAATGRYDQLFVGLGSRHKLRLNIVLRHLYRREFLYQSSSEEFRGMVWHKLDSCHTVGEISQSVRIAAVKSLIRY